MKRQSELNMQKTKILQFIHGLSMGGAETLVKDYVLGLDKNKFECILLCYERRESPYMEMIEKNGIQVIYVCDEMPLYGRKGIWARGINKIMRYVLVRKYVRKLKPDLLHEHLQLNSYLRFAKPKKNTAIVYTQHFQVSQWIQKYPNEIRTVKWLMKRYQMQLIALNESMKREMDELFHIQNTVVLNNGIDMERFRNAKEKNLVRKALNIPQDAFLIGHVGRFSQVKNHEFLVDIFAEVAKKESMAYLLMVGSGERKEQILEKLRQLNLEQRTEILSDRVDIPDLMNAMDMFVFPSLSEGLGIVLVEAQISKLKCLVSDTVPKEVEFSNLIRYCSLNEKPEIWANKILNWKKQQVQYYGAEQWDIKKVIRNLEKIYEGLLVQANHMEDE